MRTYIIIFFILAVAMCDKVNAQKVYELKGTWIVNADQTLSAMENSEREKYDSTSARFKESVGKTLASRTFNFMDANRVSIDYTVGEGTKHSEGSWTYAKNTGTLTITINNKQKKYTVQWKDINQLVLINQDESATAMSRSLYLIRKN